MTEHVRADRLVALRVTKRSRPSKLPAVQAQFRGFSKLQNLGTAQRRFASLPSASASNSPASTRASTPLTPITTSYPDLSPLPLPATTLPAPTAPPELSAVEIIAAKEAQEQLDMASDRSIALTEFLRYYSEGLVDTEDLSLVQYWEVSNVISCTCSGLTVR